MTPGTNWNFFWDWLLEHGSGHDGDTRWYAGGSRNWSGSIELAEMINSPGAQYMRDQFKQNGCKDILHSNYGTLRAAWDTVLPHMHWGDTSAQVGGFTFAVVSVGGGNVEFRIQILADQQDLNLARRSGKWEFRNGQEAQVVLHGGLAIDETTGKVDHELSRADNGLSIFPVRRRFGKIKLIVNEDLNLSFSKSPS